MFKRFLGGSLPHYSKFHASKSYGKYFLGGVVENFEKGLWTWTFVMAIIPPLRKIWKVCRKFSNFQLPILLTCVCTKHVRQPSNC